MAESTYQELRQLATRIQWLANLPLDSEDPTDKNKVIVWLKEFVPKMEEIESNLNAKITTCYERLESTERELDREKQSAETKLRGLENRLQGERDQLRQSREELNMLQGQLLVERNQLLQSQTLLVTLQEQLRAAQDQLQVKGDLLQQVQEELDAEISGSRVTWEDWQSQADDLKNRMKQITLTLQNQDTTAQSSRQEVHDVLLAQTTTIPELERERGRMRQELVDNESERVKSTRKQEAKIRHLQDQVGIQSGEVERQRNLANGKEDTIKFLRSALAKEKAEAKQLRKQLTREQRERRIADDKTEKMRSDLTQERSHQEGLKEQLFGANSQLGQLVTQNKELLQTTVLANQLQTQLNEAQRQHTETTDELRQASEKVIQLQDQLLLEQQDRADVAQELREELKARRTATEELSQARNQIAQLNAQLSHAPSISPAWKDLITPPPPSVSNEFVWPLLPEPLAGRLRRLRVKPHIDNRLDHQQVLNRFIAACREEAVADRLEEMTRRAWPDNWYCFECICEYGVHDEESRTAHRNCKRHKECFMIRMAVEMSLRIIIFRERV
ncbi:hypothetical protein F4818DRAFT_438853 [Hypoxylon cercidicola]|nr:hypothetical protein F4818DRAFT_438853 [Hypoxylon cercidicola]